VVIVVGLCPHAPRDALRASDLLIDDAADLVQTERVRERDSQRAPRRGE
jgi:hypothetical protein